MNLTSDKGGNQKTQDLALIGACAVLIAVCSWITIPTMVPFTMQTFGVFMAIGILGGRRGTLAVLVYILMGLAGLPVFAGFSGGAGVLLSMSGGYIIGFLFGALFMWLMESFFGKNHVIFAFSMAGALLICYTFGTVWFYVVYLRTNGPVGILSILGWCVFPFVIPDLLKIALAFVLSPRIRRVLQNI